MSSNLWAQTETLPQFGENNQNLFYKQVIIEILCELTKRNVKTFSFSSQIKHILIFVSDLTK